MLGGDVLVVEGDDVTVGGKVPEVVEGPVVADLDIGHDERGTVVRSVGQHPEPDTERDGSRMGHARKLSGANHPHDGWLRRFGHRPSSRAMTMRWISLVPSPISRIFASRQWRATGNSFMNP